MISIVLRVGPENYDDAIRSINRHLREIKHQILIVGSWDKGVPAAKEEYVCFLDPVFMLSANYFSTMLKTFLDKDHFRKLSIVSPSVADRKMERIYGYRVEEGEVIPLRNKLSSSPYSVQIGYIPGAVIRRSVLKEFEGYDNDPLQLSANLSMYLWEKGLRPAIHPDASYFSPSYRGDGHITVSDKVKNIWKREAI